MSLSLVAQKSLAAPQPEERPFRAPDLAVVIPTFNEAENVVPLLAKLERALEGIAWEAIFVDDWSTDGTGAVVQELSRTRSNVRLISRYGRRGLSSAVIEGMLASSAPAFVVIDADLQHDERIIPELYWSITEGPADVAIGTRYAAGGSTGEWAQSRVRISGFATKLARLFPMPEVSDPMSGFFAVKREAMMDALPHLSTTGFKILLDLLVSSPRRLEVAEVPYKFRQRVAGESKLDSAIAFEFGMLILDKMVGRWVSPRFIMFGAVGSLGVLLHLTFLSIFLGAGGLFAAAQTGAVVLTIAANFLLNNQLTYRDRRLSGLKLLKGLAGFYLVCGLGAIANVGVGSMVFASQHIWWVAGLAGAVIGSLWNYMASSILVWKKR
jgi:dolichol-phosphate mannosyltransferase